MSSTRSWSLRILSMALLLTSFTRLEIRPNPAPSTSIFIVNTENDMILPDGYLSLREAILVSEGLMSCGWVEPEKSLLTGCTWDPSTNCISGGCGVGYFDIILFDSTVDEIRLYEKLPVLYDEGTWINGTKSEGGKVVLSTWPVSFVADELVEIQGDDVTLSNLVFVNGVISDILVWWTAERARIAYNHLGVLPGSASCDQPSVERSASTGIWVHGPTQPLSDRAFIYGNVIGCHSGDGITSSGDHLFVGYQPDKATPDGNWIGVSPSGASLPNGGHGIRISRGRDR